MRRMVHAAGAVPVTSDSLDAAVELESMEPPSCVELEQRVREQGLKAALAWRDRRFAGSPDAE